MSRPKPRARPAPMGPGARPAKAAPVKAVVAAAPAPGAEEPTPLWLRLAGLGVACVAAFVLAIVCAFYTPVRIGTVLIPVSLVLVVGGLVGILRFTHWITRHPWLSLIPGGVWLVASMILTGTGRGGDLVLIASNWVATVYLLVGAVTVGVLGYRMVLATVRSPLGVHSRREPPRP